MDAVKYIKALRRLCESKRKCTECPLLNKEESYCIVDTGEYAEKAVQIVEQWAKDHPVKTRQSELLKIFPDAKIDDDGILAFCPDAFSPKEIDDEHCHKYNKCEECRKDYWLTEVTDNGND